MKMRTPHASQMATPINAIDELKGSFCGKPPRASMTPHAKAAAATISPGMMFTIPPSYQIRMTMKYTELAKGLRHG